MHGEVAETNSVDRVEKSIRSDAFSVEQIITSGSYPVGGQVICGLTEEYASPK
jgi:hypothetical protein